MSQEKISEIIKDISALKTRGEKLISQLDELITQKVENEMRLEGIYIYIYIYIFKVLEDDSVLHKLVGLVLVKEEKSKCYDTISRRLQYITGEIENRKKVITNSEEKLRKLFSDKHTQDREKYPFHKLKMNNDIQTNHVLKKKKKKLEIKQ
ncbi:hypothetical protein PFDG_04184 [Plasmodium falciparum Dd2]|uniref:Prefoldin subunit n=1 Tax=Plasmodium falciparum (isolate Dd2) TaxID=57267 RepID=A0A0L7M4F9_PLAF4|nr:hypothetical protein PFDG_04184 [Plasmodium falciparum Dd2]